MLIVMQQGASQDQVSKVLDRIDALGFTGHPIPGKARTAIGITGNEGPVEKAEFEFLEGVSECIPVSKPYKLVSREVKSEDTIINIGGTRIGQGGVTVMAGPCSVENREQVVSTAEAVKSHGASILRGGAYKPRTSPYAFQGLKEEGLSLLVEAREKTGLPIITEVVSVETLEKVVEVADILQIGARNVQNFPLLEAIGETKKPVMLKRGLATTVQEWLMAAEYIAAKGNLNIMLCERGIRTFETATRNTLDLGIIPGLREMTHLPIVVDPSHGTGYAASVSPLALAGVAAGADAIMVEVHPEPSKALSDGPQALTFDRFADMMTKLRMVAKAVGKELV